MKSASGTDSALKRFSTAFDRETVSHPTRDCSSYANAICFSLGELAADVRRRLHPEPVVTFVIDRNINYTNVCTTGCEFCAFYRDRADPDAYVLPWERISTKIRELVDAGGTQVLLQGGHNRPQDRLLRGSLPKDQGGIPRSFARPFAVRNHLYIKDFAPGYRHDAGSAQEAGLASIPGGGAEILSDRVREIISPRKISSDEWIGVMRRAHLAGIPSSSTMMFRKRRDARGHRRAPDPPSKAPGRDRRIYGLHSMELPTGFGLPRSRRRPRPSTTCASRRSPVYLDNIPNIQSSWVTQGPKIGQVALFFGVNDMGGTMMEENVVSAAGTSHRMTIDEMIDLIREAGFMPCQRNTLYEIMKRF